jgi:hypothetical protein
MSELAGGPGTAAARGPAPEAAGYAETSIGLTMDPVAAGTALARRAQDPYVLLERHGEEAVAFGAAAEIVLDRQEIRYRVGEHRGHVATGGEPLQQVHALLAGTGLRGWRAYGWCAFELSHLLHGDPDAAGDEPLAHLVVPRSEARLSGREARLRALRPDDLAGLCREISTLPESPGGVTCETLADERSGHDGYLASVSRAIGDIRERRFQKVILSRVVPVPGRPGRHLHGGSCREHAGPLVPARRRRVAGHRVQPGDGRRGDRRRRRVDPAAGRHAGAPRGPGERRAPAGGAGQRPEGGLRARAVGARRPGRAAHRVRGRLGAGGRLHDGARAGERAAPGHPL